MNDTRSKTPPAERRPAERRGSGGWLAGLGLRQKLLGAFAINLLLMVTLGGFALYQTGVMDEKATQVEVRTIPSIRNVARIVDLISRYRTQQLEYLLYGNAADRTRLRFTMAELEGEMEQRLVAQGRFLVQGLEKDAFEEFANAWGAYVEANHRRFLPLVEGSQSGTVQPAFTRLNPLHDHLVEAAEQLAEIDAAAASEAMGVVQETHRTSRVFISINTLVAVLLSAVVGLALAAGLIRRMERLGSVTRRVAAGDLDQRVDASGSDELAQLAESFDRMVIGLRHQRAVLEQRQRELQASLDEQRRLTEDLLLRKQAEEAAYRARAAAEARDSAKSIFLASMSHELRTPLNAILGYVQLMTLDARARGEASFLDDLRRVEGAGKHLLTVINNVLDFSKIEQGKVDVELSTFSLRTLAKEVVEILEPLARERRNRLVLQCTVDVGEMESDAAKVRQVLFNLLSNAVKFTEDGEVGLWIERCNEDGRECISIAVSDTGIGIAPEHLDRVFEPFHQGDSSVQRRFGGTGLGLVISRQLCELLGGSIEVGSELGKGSTFTALLPTIAPDLDETFSGSHRGLVSRSTPVLSPSISA